MARPTADSVKELRQHLIEVWRATHGHWIETQSFIDQTHPIRVVKPAKPRRLGLAASKLLSQVDSLVTLEPVVKVHPFKDSEGANEIADRQEKWCQFLLQEAARRANLPPFRSAGFNLSAFGYTVGVIRWDETQRTGRKPFPFVIEFPHPARILVPYNEREVTVAIEIATMPTWEVERRWPELMTSIHTEGPYSNLEIVLFTDPDWRAVFVNGEEAVVEENPKHLVPYFHAFAGKGYEHAPVDAGGGALSSYGPKPEDLAVGLLDRVRDSITAADELHTARVARVLRNTYLRMFANGNTANLAEQLAQAGLGAVIDTSMVDKIQWEEPSPIEPDLPGLSDAVVRDIDEGTFSGVVAGQRQPGVETATEFALMLGSARIGFGVPMQGINRMAGTALELAGAICVEYDESLTLGGITVKPSEFERGMDVEVDFLHKDEGELQRERQIGMEEVARGLRSTRRYFEATGVSDSTGEQDQIWVDAAMKSDPVQQAIIAAATGLFQQKVEKAGGQVPSVPGAGVSGIQATPQPEAALPSFVGTPALENQSVPPEAAGRLMPGF